MFSWDIKNHTWLITEYLRPLVINVEFKQGGVVKYKSVNFAGYVGVLSAVCTGHEWSNALDISQLPAKFRDSLW